MNNDYSKFEKLPKEKTNRELIHIQDVGGISHFTYNVVRYKEYRYDDDVNLEKYGICGQVIAPYKFEEPETDIKIKENGKQILLSIYELAYQINEAPLSEHPNKSYMDLIMDWCINNFHPYDIELLYSKYKKTLSENEERLGEPDVIDGTFELKRFMRDLEYVYQAFTYIIAFQELLKGDAIPAYNLYKEGKFFDTLSFFDEYKNPSWQPYNKVVKSNKVPTREELLAEMRESSKKAEEERLEYEKLSLEEQIDIFKKNALKDKENIYQSIANFFPDIKMHLQYDFKNKGIAITATIDSVFDICWYTMARMVTFYGLNDEDRTLNRVYKEKQWYYDEGNYGTCLFCGKPFLVEGARQKYCKKPECQKARKRKNAKDCYNKKKLDKSM